MGRVVSLIYASFLECLRATVFIFIGSSVTAQAILRRNLSDNTVVCVGWGAAYLLSSLVLIGVYDSAIIPVVAICKLCNHELKTAEFLLYLVAQTVGTFVGALLTWLLVYEAVFQLDKGNHMLTGPLRTAQIFAGYPSVHQSSVNAFIAEVTASFVFAFFISTVRKRHSHVIVNKVVQSIALALTLMSLDFNSTTTLNPAREIGSRAASFLFGYDEKVFSYRSSKWLVIVTIGPLIGATVSAWLCSWLSHCGNSKKVRNVSDKTCQTQPHLYGVHFDNLDSRML